EKRNEAQRRENHDELLRRPFLRSRPTAHAAFEQGLIVSYEIPCGERRRAKKEREIYPRLPIVNGPGGEEDQNTHHAGKNSECNPCSRRKVLHRRGGSSSRLFQPNFTTAASFVCDIRQPFSLAGALR